MPSTEALHPASDAISPETLLAQLRWRYATKRFDPAHRIDAATWSALEQALVLSPSSYGLQPWHFVVVTAPETKARLQAVSNHQAQVGDCSHLVVFAHRKGLTTAEVARHADRVAALRGLPRESLAGFERTVAAHLARPGFDVDEWTRRQLYIALGTFLASAALLGVDACPLEGIQPAGYDEVLGLRARGYAAVCAAAAGRRAADDKYGRLAKVRFDPGDVISHVA